MPYELFLALRYLRSRRRRRMARVTALLALAGIACGVAAMIVSLALANGFRDEMRNKILRGTAHISLMRSDGQPLINYRDTIIQIKNVPGVIEASPTTYDGAVVTGPTNSSYAVMRGIDEASSVARLELQRTLIEGTCDSLFEPALDEDQQPRLPNVVIGAELARQTGLKIGDVAELIPASASVARGTPVRRNVQVAGIFRSGLFEYDSTWIYIAFERAAIFAGSERAASLISVSVQNVDDVSTVATEMRNRLGPQFSIIDWKQANVRLFSALELERRAGAIVIALIVLIAALNITTTLVLVVVERRSDIATLRAIGATSLGIMFIFLIEGAIIGGVGAIAGVALGRIACALGNYFKLVRLPADVYSIGSVPFNAHLNDTLIAAAVAILLTLFATIYPAWSATRVSLIDTLKERS